MADAANVRMSARAPPENARALPEIDALRGVAVILLLALHCGVLRYGWIGVWLFFVISGFVITHSLLRRGEPGQGGAASFLDFMRRRGFRIWPALLIYAAIALMASAFSGGGVEWAAFLSAIGFVTNLYNMTGRPDLSPFPINHAWTLAVELHFYLLFGLAFFKLGRRVLIFALLAIIAATPLIRIAVSAWGLERYGPTGAFHSVYMFTFCHLDSFAFGALLAIFRERILRSPEIIFYILAGGMAAATSYVCFAFCLNLSSGAQGADLFRNILSGELYGGGREIVVYSAVALGAAALVLAALIRTPGLARVLSSNMLREIGRVSYGVYIYHAAVVTVCVAVLGLLVGAEEPMDSDNIVNNLIVFALASPIAFLVARMSHRWIETPMIDYGRRVGRRLRAGGTPSVAPIIPRLPRTDSCSAERSNAQASP